MMLTYQYNDHGTDKPHKCILGDTFNRLQTFSTSSIIYNIDEESPYCNMILKQLPYIEFINIKFFDTLKMQCQSHVIIDNNEDIRNLEYLWFDFNICDAFHYFNDLTNIKILDLQHLYILIMSMKMICVNYEINNNIFYITCFDPLIYDKPNEEKTKSTRKIKRRRSKKRKY